MNTFVSTLTRDLTCAAAAAVITLIAAASFVQSTSAPPFGQTIAVTKTVAMQVGQHA